MEGGLHLQAFFVFLRHLPGALCTSSTIAGRHLLRNCHNACRLIVPIHDRRPGLIHLNRPVSPFVIVAPSGCGRRRFAKARRHQPVPGTCPAAVRYRRDGMTNRNRNNALLASVAIGVAAMLGSADAIAADMTQAAPAPTAEEAPHHRRAG